MYKLQRSKQTTAPKIGKDVENCDSSYPNLIQLFLSNKTYRKLREFPSYLKFCSYLKTGTHNVLI